MARTKDYREDLIERLRNDPEYGGHYVNAALEEGTGAFLVALKDVVDAWGGASHLARSVEAHRVSIYKMLSKQGNPSFKNVEDILAAIGLRFTVERREQKAGG